MDEQSFDYVIAGGGTAGCVLANRLSADPEVRVLLLEGGGSGRHPYVEVPLLLPYLIGNDRFDWMYQTEPEPHLNGRRLPLPRGRMLGGSSGINGMVYVRGHRWDYDNWATLGNAGWGWSEILPYFMRSEAYGGTDAQGRGTTGEWRIGDPGMRWEALDAYLDAAAEAGIPGAADYNCGDNEGAAYFQASVHRGMRQSTAKAFLRPAQSRANLTVRTGTVIDRVLTDNGRASGVIYRGDGGAATATARRDVILCCGAYGTPALLERSGIGAADRVRALGVEPVLDRPAVGENLQDHWQIRIQHRLRDTVTLNGKVKSLLGKALLGLDYVTRRRGALSAQPALLAAFTRVMEDAPAPDVQIHVSAASSERVGGPMHDFPGITSAVCILRPESRGHVHATSPDPEAAPSILHNYLAAEYDREIAVRCVELVRRIAASPSMARFSPEEVAPGPDLQTREDLVDFARRTISTTFHPVGTCRMGTDEQAVVDPALRLRGIAGLRVVDASVMPVIPSGNTAAPVVMIAEKAADLIRGQTHSLAA